METIIFSKIVTEDLDIGDSTRSLRLQDGSLVTANQLQLSSLALLRTRNVSLGSGTDQAVLTGMIPAGAMVLGVTVKNLTLIASGFGLTSYLIGDTIVIDRWGAETTLAPFAETSMADFSPGAWPIYPSATDVLLTAQGGNFSTGLIEVTVHYFTLRHRTAA